MRLSAVKSFAVKTAPTNFANASIPGPVRRPSGGAVERGVWHGCQTRNDGPGMAHRDDPRNSTVARGVERSETRMPGALSLWLLSLCARKEKVTRRKGETSNHSRCRYAGIRKFDGYRSAYSCELNSCFVWWQEGRDLKCLH